MSCPFSTSQSEAVGLPPGGRPPRSDTSIVTVYPNTVAWASSEATYFAARPMITPSSTSQSVWLRPWGITIRSLVPTTAPRDGLR